MNDIENMNDLDKLEHALYVLLNNIDVFKDVVTENNDYKSKSVNRARLNILAKLNRFSSESLSHINTLKKFQNNK